MKKLMILFCIAGSLSSCLKKDDYHEYVGIKPLLINPLSNYPAASLFAPPLTDSVFGITRLNLTARYSFQSTTENDITVTFSRNDSLATAYNNSHGNSYSLLPADAYDAAGLKLTIFKGSNQAVLPIKIIPAKINGARNFIVAFTISNAEGTVIGETTKSIVYTLKGQ